MEGLAPRLGEPGKLLSRVIERVQASLSDFGLERADLESFVNRHRASLLRGAAVALYGGPVKTPGGGERCARPMESTSITVGMRVVADLVAHGEVIELDNFVMVTRDLWTGASVGEERRHIRARVQLDSGRFVSESNVWYELEPALRVTPDVLIDGEWRSPTDVWSILDSRRHAWERASKAARKAKPARAKALQLDAEEAGLRFRDAWAPFEAWMASHGRPPLVTTPDGIAMIAKYTSLANHRGLLPEGR